MHTAELGSSSFLWAVSIYGSLSADCCLSQPDIAPSVPCCPLHNEDLSDINGSKKYGVSGIKADKPCHRSTCQHIVFKKPSLLLNTPFHTNQLTPHLFLDVLMRVSQILVVIKESPGSRTPPGSPPGPRSGRRRAPGAR